ncbi:MAG: ABC transporter ATP-binding protein, partial [Lachnospiraceae bacterium]|nr:ABC transporter ATP-binding protein [Lachnospiraceae bacterium]
VFGIINHGKLIKELTEEKLKAECEEKIEIITENTDLASSILEENDIKDFEVVEADKIHLYGNQSKVPAINRMLVQHGVDINGIHVIGSSLENYYLSCIGNGGN